MWIREPMQRITGSSNWLRKTISSLRRITDWLRSVLAKDVPCCTIGFAYTNDNIDRLLTTRHANAKARRGGQKTKGPKPLTDEDKARFQALLWETIKKIR